MTSDATLNGFSLLPSTRPSPCSLPVVQTRNDAPRGHDDPSSSSSPSYPSRYSLPELLERRQTYGVLHHGGSSSSNSGTSHRLSMSGFPQNGGPTRARNGRQSNQVPSPYLAYRGAWNATRLQNTILVVGPGTPASVLYNDRKGKSTNGREEASRRDNDGSSLSASSSSSDEGGEEGEDKKGQPIGFKVDNVDSAADEDDGGKLKEKVEKAIDEKIGARQDENEDNDDDDDEEEEQECDDQAQATASSRRLRWTTGASLEDSDEDDEEKEEDDEDEYTSRDSDRRCTINRSERQCDRGELMGVYQALDDSEDDDSDEDDGDSDENNDGNEMVGSDDDDTRLRTSRSTIYCPSMRHAGCINTAAWLDCGWRLATTQYSDTETIVKGYKTEECPTQLITSGDDYRIKIWDVQAAMGAASPLPGGRSTLCPFSASVPRDSSELEKKWRSMSRGNHDNLPGSVRLLASVHSGHRGNVFHVTALEGKRGNVATCGADGFLRLTDVEMGESSIVVSPEHDDELGLLPAGFLSFRAAMCFSHHFLNQNVGLLCSERGLRRFDLRIPPREQPTRSLLGGSFRSCKACAILSAPSSSSFDQGDSAYVFAGGSSPNVALCDLRMTDNTFSNVIQYYNPSSLSLTDPVSVSGLDVSRDGKELLVSYESDQIYTFPIFPESESPNSSTMDQINEFVAQRDRKKADEPGSFSSSTASPGRNLRVGKPLNELAAYGGHLNRFTFLKNARYAGPRDEYICTGSDSGHAWIYEKASGAVVSFLKADNSTCNGVIPHPTLPVFITYGIDSTAKLWRSTVPVDSNVDDSAVGRRRHKRERPYNMSGLCADWGEIQTVLEALEPSDVVAPETDIYPDQIPSQKNMRRHRLSRSSWLRHAYSSSGRKTPQIGNNLHDLPQTLEENLFSCLQSMFDDGDVPVESNMAAFKNRISLIRLRHQADGLGLKWDPCHPWIMEQETPICSVAKMDALKDAPEDHEVDPADLVPEHPSDWIPYDPDMCRHPFDFCKYFNTREYGDFFRQRHGALDERGAVRFRYGCDTYKEGPEEKEGIGSDEIDKVQEADAVHENDGVITTDDDVQSGETADPNEEDGAIESSKNDEMDESGGSDDGSTGESALERRRDPRSLLLETMMTLKEGGNAALRSGNYDLAAYRYDKAIQYGALHFMRFQAQASPNLRGSSLGATGSISCATARRKTCNKWSSLLRTLIVTRLNLALVLLKPHFGQSEAAANQAELAIKDLNQFTEFKVRKKLRSDTASMQRKPPPADPVVDEALSLQAKAYFRLGSAQFEQKQYRLAIESFEASVLSTQLIGDGNVQPENLVLRRLNEAKRENVKRTKRHRKKFKLAFAAVPTSTVSTSPPSSPTSHAKSSFAVTPEMRLQGVTTTTKVTSSTTRKLRSQSQ